jgi:hypothetical protein
MSAANTVDDRSIFLIPLLPSLSFSDNESAEQDRLSCYRTISG